MGKCVFCDKNNSPRDTIFETKNFFVKIGLGLAAPGHVMLIPKEHFICFADLPAGLRAEFLELKNLVFEKVSAAFGAPFLVEYGPQVQSVAHAHLHFIPKKRQQTQDYAGYEIGNIFAEMEIPDGLIERSFSWEAAIDLRQKFGKYVFLQDAGRACLFSESGSGSSLKKLGYRLFFSEKLELADIPAHWEEITQEQLRIDALKKDLTRARLKF